MHCIIPYMFDCWAHLVVHLLLLKSSMSKHRYFAFLFLKFSSLGIKPGSVETMTFLVTDSCLNMDNITFDTISRDLL